MKRLFTVWMFVALATIGVGVCDDTSLVFESHKETVDTSSLSDTAFMADVSESDSRADPKDQFQYVLDNTSLNETNFSPNTVKQSTEQVRRKRSTILPSTSAYHQVLYPIIFDSGVLNLIPFRNAQDFYYTITDVIFRRPGFVIGVLNLAVIVVGPYWIGVRPFTFPVNFARSALPSHQSSNSDTFVNVMKMLEHVTSDEVTEFIQNSILAKDSVTMGSGGIDKTAAAMIALQNLTRDIDEISGIFDAVDSFKPNELQPLIATATKEKTDKRMRWAKTSRQFLKMIWERRPGFLRKGNRTMSTRYAPTEANNVNNSDTAMELSPELENMNINKPNIDNADRSTAVQGNPENDGNQKKLPSPKIVGPDQTRNAGSNSDVIKNVLKALSQVSDNGFVMGLIQTYLPILMKRLSDNGFTVTDFIATVNLSGNIDPQNILAMLKENQSFVDAMAATLNVSPEMFDQMSILQLVVALPKALSNK